MPAQKQILLIGGPLDGQRRTIKTDLEYIRLPVQVDNAFEPLYRTEHYRQTFIYGHLVYAHADLLLNDIIRKLLEHYKPNDNHACPRCLGQGCRLCTKPARGQAA